MSLFFFNWKSSQNLNKNLAQCLVRKDGDAGRKKSMYAQLYIWTFRHKINIGRYIRALTVP